MSLPRACVDGGALCAIVSYAPTLIGAIAGVLCCIWYVLQIYTWFSARRDRR